MIRLLIPLLFLITSCTDRSLSSYVNTCSITDKYRLTEAKYEQDSVMTTYESYLETDAAKMLDSEENTITYLESRDFNKENCEKFELESRLSKLQYALEAILTKMNKEPK